MSRRELTSRRSVPRRGSSSFIIAICMTQRRIKQPCRATVSPAVSASRGCVLRDDAFSGTRARRPCRVGASVRACVRASVRMVPAERCCEWVNTYVFGSMQCPAATRQGDGKQCEHTLLILRPVLAHCATRCASARGIHPHLVRTHPSSPGFHFSCLLLFQQHLKHT